ncbi:MAG: alkaline phosphatase family protein [Candidatus Aminicenantes bacterium]|jgi:predicted AlkP superfamily phosphohydrolase/phosphomutase|nr:alkaline phosphatase family protein [Candidatus Aminicenantes bacterium]
MTIFKKNKPRKKVCIVGLDGVPYSMLLELAKSGVMSTISRLIEAGHLHQIKASLPEISAVSWTNFMTGTNPGTHGIFGFTDFKPGSYDLRIPNFLDLKAETIWDTLGSRGLKSIVINQPSTYPARRINGVIVSGFVAIDLSRSVYPQSYFSALEQMGYQIDVDTSRVVDNLNFLWQELSKTMASHQKALNYFWEQEWDLFEFVITGTDRLHHFLWPAYQDKSHPHHQAFLDFYQQIDRIIGKILNSFKKMEQSEDQFFLLSDHGFTGIVQEVYLNAWLEQQGYLIFNTPTPKSLEDISPKTIAFALDPNRIYLNLKNKFPRGIVERKDKKALKEEISQKLLQLEYNGQKVIRRVFNAEEIYKGKYVSQGPDLIVLSTPGFDLKGSIKKKEIFGRSYLQGMHTWDDAFFWSAEDYGPDLTIENLANIILKKIK